MKREKGRLWTAVALILVAVWFFAALHQLGDSRGEEERLALETALRRGAVACYASEGFYPPDLAYLQEHYGVQVDESRYIVHYQVIAENWMPDITVLER